MWGQLLAHHSREAAHLAALGAVRPPEESWRLRRGQYLDWLREPLAAVPVARDGTACWATRACGWSTLRGPGSGGDRVGVRETLVVHDEARGAGIGQALVGAARTRLAGSGVQVMKISVIAGNAGALRFYQREGAVDFAQTLVMPVSG
ncbi:GNAT family N-acetyltransferase [Streptomyces sp. NPDC088194]|uniref:GNAT family N-acetyltransferase n=1 Tax=Streptomyces sp. NPDC088194 TaxID=3154931 RepID=UPI00344E0F11